MNKDIQKPGFAYFMGFFIADGSFYSDGRSSRFEFSDGSSVEDELKYSKEFLDGIKILAENITGRKLAVPRRRKNRFVLAFRSKELENIMTTKFNMKPGPKSGVVKLPRLYKGTELEKYFWLGVMDGDGMVARGSKKIALTSISETLVDDFTNFLKKKNIRTVYLRRNIKTFGECTSHTATINSPFFYKYVKEVGFSHPRKVLWIKKHLKEKTYIKNVVVNQKVITVNGSNILDLEKIFRSDRLFIVSGKRLLKKHGIKVNGRDNVQFRLLLELLENKGMKKQEIYIELNRYRWKMSKGSTVSVKVPLRLTKSLREIAPFVRLRDGGITISREYTKAFGIGYKTLIKKIESIFGVKAKYTKQGEPIFSSTVLAHFFAKVIKRQEQVASLPKWRSNIIQNTKILD